MYKYRMPLYSAYEFVKVRRMEINPNPGFMSQLQNYEYELEQMERSHFNSDLSKFFYYF